MCCEEEVVYREWCLTCEGVGDDVSIMERLAELQGSGAVNILMLSGIHESLQIFGNMHIISTKMRQKILSLDLRS